MEFLAIHGRVSEIDFLLSRGTKKINLSGCNSRKSLDVFYKRHSSKILWR